jgi:exosome complex component RRP41
LEDSSGNPDIPVAIFPKSNKITMLQMDSKLPLEKLEKVLKVAIDGCQRIYQHMVDVTRNHAQNLVNTSGIFTV